MELLQLLLLAVEGLVVPVILGVDFLSKLGQVTSIVQNCRLLEV